MRIEEEVDTSHLETTFSASKKNSKDKQTSKVKTCNCKDEEKEEDEEMKGNKSPRKFNKQGKKKWLKKSFLSKEDSSSSE